MHWKLLSFMIFLCISVCVFGGGGEKREACMCLCVSNRKTLSKQDNCNMSSWKHQSFNIYEKILSMRPSGIYSTCNGRYCTSISSCKAATSCHLLLCVFLSILTHFWSEGNPTLIWRASFMQNWFHSSLLTQWKKHIHIYSWGRKLENATFDFDFFFHFNKKSK